MNQRDFFINLSAVRLEINSAAISHRRKAAIENVNTIDERRSKIVRTEFSIAKWQSKILFLAIFDSRSSIVKSVFDCRLPGVNLNISLLTELQIDLLTLVLLNPFFFVENIVDPNQLASDQDPHCFPLCNLSCAAGTCKQLKLETSVVHKIFSMTFRYSDLSGEKW